MVCSSKDVLVFVKTAGASERLVVEVEGASENVDCEPRGVESGPEPERPRTPEELFPAHEELTASEAESWVTNDS